MVAFERSAVIAYRVERGSVRILNIFYGGRHLEAVYRGDTAGGAQEPPSSGS